LVSDGVHTDIGGSADLLATPSTAVAADRTMGVSQAIAGQCLRMLHIECGQGSDDGDSAEREMLCETCRVWQDSDASVRGAAEVLFCHPNTVRNRLRRIEKRTGRSLSRPKDVAELCLAFEVHRRLM
jgi:hypothetical protein